MKLSTPPPEFRDMKAFHEMRKSHWAYHVAHMVDNVNNTLWRLWRPDL